MLRVGNNKKRATPSEFWVSYVHGTWGRAWAGQVGWWGEPGGAAMCGGFKVASRAGSIPQRLLRPSLRLPGQVPVSSAVLTGRISSQIHVSKFPVWCLDTGQLVGVFSGKCHKPRALSPRTTC